MSYCFVGQGILILEITRGAAKRIPPEIMNIKGNRLAIGDDEEEASELPAPKILPSVDEDC